MWDGLLGWIILTKNCIKSTEQDVPPITPAPYQARPEARSEWASQIVFTPKKRFVTLLYWLEEAKWRDRQGHLSHSEDGPMARFTSQGAYIFDIRCPFGLLANRLTRMTETKKLSSPIMDFIDLSVCLSVLKTIQPHFRERWTTYGRPSKSNLHSSI